MPYLLHRHFHRKKKLREIREANSQAGENCGKTEGATSTAVFLLRHTGKILVTFLVNNFHAGADPGFFVC